MHISKKRSTFAPYKIKLRMKKLLIYATLVFAMILTACGGNDSAKSTEGELLIGKWKLTTDHGFSMLTFNADGTGRLDDYWKGRLDGVNITFYYDEQIQHYVYSYPYDGRDIVYPIMYVTENELMTIAINTQHVYYRIE